MTLLPEEAGLIATLLSDRREGHPTPLQSPFLWFNTLALGRAQSPILKVQLSIFFFFKTNG